VLLDSEGHVKLWYALEFIIDCVAIIILSLTLGPPRSDFGSAKFGVTERNTGATLGCGTTRYFAPEVFCDCAFVKTLVFVFRRCSIKNNMA
jgi:hypothetical protein